MSVKVSSWVWHDKATEGVNGNELILLLSLADVADDNGHCRYLADDLDLTYDGLATKVRVDRRTIERLIPKLRSRGLIEHVKGSKSRPNEFAIVVPWAAASTDKVSGNRRKDSPTAVQDSPTAATLFPDNGGSHSSIDVFNVTTRITPSDADASDSGYSDDVKSLCQLLGELVEANGHKVGTIGKQWWAACDRLMRLDGYSREQIEIMIRWSTSDEFWSANIRSMPKLREKFSTLRVRRNSDLAKKKPTKTERAMSTVMMGRALEEAQAEQLELSR